MKSTSERGKELLPCPFCGGKAEFERMGTARASCIIVCQDCGCRLETGEIWNAGSAWNSRRESPLLGDALKALEDIFRDREVNVCSEIKPDTLAKARAILERSKGRH